MGILDHRRPGTGRLGWLGAATLVVLALGIPSPRATAAPRPGIEGKEAPSWEGVAWRNLPEGRKTLDVGDFRGKVVYLYAFQSWCPGCLKVGFPTLQDLVGRYTKAEDTAFVAVQTVFEGFSTNTPERGWETVRKYKLDIPTGQDGTEDAPSVLMRRYRTGGTPWVVIIDKTGKVRFNGFHIRPDDAAALIDRLRKE